jgi:signal transduction histidine kinase
MKRLTYLFGFILVINLFTPLHLICQNKQQHDIDSLKTNLDYFLKNNNEDSLVMTIEALKETILGKELYVKMNEMRNIWSSNNNALRKEIKIEKERSSMLSLVLLLVSFIAFIYLIRFTDKKSREAQEKKIAVVKNITNYEEETKMKISEKLHDDIGGSLAALKMRLSQLNDPNYCSSLSNEIKSLDNIYNDVRALSRDLNTQNKFSQTIQEGIDILINEMCSSFKNTICNVYPEKKINKIKDKELIQNIILTTKELITNVIKHAEAQEITIDIAAHEKDIVVMVTDNGKGFDKNKIKNGQGLNHIKNRVELWGGNMEIDSKIKNGTTITAAFLIEN